MKILRSNIVFGLLLVILVGINIALFRPELFKPDGHVHFELKSKDGANTFTISEKSIEGSWSLFYFGYTFCPDVCPTSLSYWSATLKQLDQNELNRLRFFFVSVDPERDSLDKVAAYTKHFHPKMEALWGTSEQIRPVAKQFGVIYKYYKEPEKDYYTVDHSAYTILVDPNGKIVHKFEHGAHPDDVTKKIKEYLSPTKVPTKEFQ